MANDSVQIYDHATGETIIRELTNEEQAIRDIEVAAFLAQEAKVTAEIEKAAADKAALLARLGITAEEASLLLGGTN
jgi:hypothetical protein